MEGREEKGYFGISATAFKSRYANHKKSFGIEKYKTETELSKEYWKIKRLNGIPSVEWEIIQKCATYNKNSQRCNLCISEKVKIATYEGGNMLNKRSELVSKCRHQNKFMLAKFDTKD